MHDLVDRNQHAHVCSVTDFIDSEDRQQELSALFKNTLTRNYVKTPPLQSLPHELTALAVPNVDRVY